MAGKDKEKIWRETERYSYRKKKDMAGNRNSGGGWVVVEVRSAPCMVHSQTMHAPWTCDTSMILLIIHSDDAK